jgi:hypothetical protein
MVEIKLQDLIQDSEAVESYILFRKIEDWCCDNLPRDSWRFSYSPSTSVIGVDIPGRILFKNNEAATHFKLVFPVKAGS